MNTKNAFVRPLCALLGSLCLLPALTTVAQKTPSLKETFKKAKQPIKPNNQQ
jgi:hypothetical protein